MNRRQSDGIPTDAMSDLLQEVASDHEPDRRRVVRRVGFDPTTQAAPGRLRTISNRKHAGHRPVRMLPVAAAGLAAAVFGISYLSLAGTGDHASPHSDPTRPPTATPPTSSPPSTTTSGAAPTLMYTGGPSAPALPSAPRPAVGPPGHADSTIGTDAAGGPTGHTSPVISGNADPLPNGFAIDLRAATDWAAVVRKDGTVVRSKRPRSGPIDVRWAGAATGMPSPYRVSWTGGKPEQSHTDVTTWLAIGQGASATITVPALPRAATAVLYLGARHADLVVSGAAQTSWSHQAGGMGAVAVAVALPASTSPAVLTISAARAAAGGTVGVAAVSLT